MASNTRNVKLGVCSVTFDGVDLGYTKGGVEVEVKTETKKVMVDQFGNSEINEIIIGRSATAKVPLAETTLENLARIMPGATLTASGGTKATATVTFASAAPANNDSVTLAISGQSVTFTFKTTALPNTNDISLTGITTFGQAAAAFAAAFNASTDPIASEFTATVAAGVVTLTADNAGVAQNSYTLARVGTNITVPAGFTGGADATKKKVVVTRSIGTSLLDIAKKLVLHPVQLDPANKTEDFVMPLAQTPGEIQFSYKLDDERVYMCTFTAYPDPVTKALFVVGDESAV